MRLWPFKRAEHREDLGDRVMNLALEQAATGATDINRLAVAEACAGIIGRCFAAADVEGTDMITPDQLDIMGRSLVLRGEYIGLLTSTMRLIPVSTADVLGRDPDPMEWGYRCQYSTPGGGTETIVAPAASVLHVRTGASRSAPWRGRSPLLGAMSDVELSLAASRSLASEGNVNPFTILYPNETVAPLGLSPEQVNDLTGKIKGIRGGSTTVFSQKMASERVKADPSEALDRARRTSTVEIAAAAGVPPVLLTAEADGTAAREAYRRLTRSTVEPLGRLVAHEATMKIGAPVKLDFAALRASDTAMNARAFGTLMDHGVSLTDALAIAGLVDD